jgi:hypothetical protein
MPKDGTPSFVKQRWFIALTAVIGLVGGLVAIFNGIKPYFEAKPSARALQNTEIVLDRSEGMKQRFPDGTTKLDLASRAVDLILRNEILGDNVAFREFGGSCDDDHIHLPPTLPFSEDNAARIRKKIEPNALVPKGKATLVAAIRHAIADFADAQRFGGLDKRIIVITGNLDACGNEIVKVVAQLNKLANDSQGKRKESIMLDLNFIGIGLDSAAKLEFDGYAERTGGSAHFADNPQQLQNVVEIVEVARVKRAANAVSSILRASAERLSAAITNVGKKDYTAAERGLQQARDEFADSELPFQDLVKRQTSAQLSARLSTQYRRIYQAANRSRELQTQVISVTEAILSQAKGSDERAMKGSIDKYEEIRAAYNKSDDELQALLVQLEAMTRER